MHSLLTVLLLSSFRLLPSCASDPPGYGCDRPCTGGDANYVLRAAVRRYRIRGSAQFVEPQSGERP